MCNYWHSDINQTTQESKLTVQTKVNGTKDRKVKAVCVDKNKH